MSKDRERIKKKINARLRNSFDIPCVTVFRSNTCIYCSLIDRKNNKIIAQTSSKKLFPDSKNCNIDKSTKTGEEFGNMIKKLNIDKIIFNRNGFLYHGKVKALADGIRATGIKF